jgi:hypothetical protein
LHIELNKVFWFDEKFIDWSKIEFRNYKIESLSKL